MVIARKILIVLLCVALIGGVGFIGFLHIYYSNYLPSNIDQTSGRIYTIVVNHGSMRYATASEIRLLHSANIFAISGAISGIIAGVLNFIYHDF